MGAENTDLDKTLEAWAGITLIRWWKKMRSMGIGDTGRLRQSLRYHVETSAGGENFKIEFFYAWYGKMVDMGVGKGTKLGGVSENKTSRRLEGRRSGNRRRAKTWKSPTFFAEVNTLNAILMQKYGRKTLLAIKEIVTQTSYTIQL
jgi:hypothetical protein